ncbi:MAG: ExeA family protein [Planctomycetota bacterium]
MDFVHRWGLREKPFENTLDPRFFHASPIHAEAVARLELLAADGDMGFGLLTGEIGSGKTFAAAVFAGSLDERFFVPVFLPGATFGFECVMDQVNCALRREAPRGSVRSLYQRTLEFRRRFDSRVRRKRLHLILVIDEAQEMSREDLSGLRALSNEGAGARSAMSIVLVGQPELRELVRGFPALDTRVGLRYHLRCLGEGDVGPYLEHRMRAAGFAGERAFTDAAVGVIAHASGGVPRKVNRLAKLALYAAAGRGSRLVTEAEAGSVAEDLAQSAA